MRGAPQYWPLFYQGIARACRAVALKSLPKRNQIIEIDPSPARLEARLALLQPGDRVAVDVETPRDKPTKIEICGLAFSPTETWIVSWGSAVSGIIGRLLEDPHIVKVGHNFSYDMLAFMANGIEPSKLCVDTIQASALLWPPFGESKKRKWLALSSCFLRVSQDLPYWKEPDNPVIRAFFDEAWPQIPSWQHGKLYCGLDCLATFELWHELVDLLIEEGLMTLYREIVMPAARVLIEMERRGIAVDQKRRLDLLKDCDDEKNLAELEVYRMAKAAWKIRVGEASKPAFLPCPKHPEYEAKTNRRTKCDECFRIWELMTPYREAQKRIKKLGEFNFDSPDHWRWLLFEHLKLQPVSRTDKGKPQVDDESLEKLAALHPEIPILESYLHAKKSESRIKIFLNVPLDEEGRAHFSYAMHRTSTGRISSGTNDDEEEKTSKSYNGQNIPVRDRSIYIPSFLFLRLLNADWSQIEARVMAWLANETRMLDAWKRGEDVHSLAAGGIYGIDPSQAATTQVPFAGGTIAAREAAKRGRHGLNYGMGYRHFAELFRISIAEAKEFIAKDEATWPTLTAYKKEVIERAKKDKVLVNPFGRRLRFPMFNPREALAFIPQSTVGDMCKAVLPEMNQGNLWTLLGTYHDAFLTEMNEEDVWPAMVAQRVILEREWPELGSKPAYGGYFKCPADFKTGRSWGEMEKLK